MSFTEIARYLQQEILQTIMLSNEMTENFLLRISSAKGVASFLADKNTINLYKNSFMRMFFRLRTGAGILIIISSCCPKCWLKMEMV